MIDIHSIKLGMGPSVASKSAPKGSKVSKNEDEKNNLSVDDVENDEDDEDDSNQKSKTKVKDNVPEPKFLKGNSVQSIFEVTPIVNNNENNLPGLNVRSSQVVSKNFNEKREKVNYKNYGCTFTIRNAHSQKINCLSYLINGTFLTGSSDKFVRVW